MNKQGLGGGGSFGIPKDLLDAVNESKKKQGVTPTESKSYDSESIPDFDDKEPEASKAEEKVEAVKEETEEEKMEKQLEDIKKSLGVDITEDDLWSIFMGNQLNKTGIVIIPGKLEASFSTLSVDDTQKIDKRMAEALEEKFLEAGFMNLKTKHLLAAGLTGLGKPGKLKPIGTTHEERFEQLGKMSTILVERLAHKWNQYTWLVNQCVNKEMDLGKS